MTVTFDKSATPFITQALGTLRGRNCYYCGTPLNQENFAGAVKREKVVFFCNCFPCLLEFSDEQKTHGV